MAQLTRDLVVIANQAGGVTVDKLPFHTGRGEPRVGAGQFDRCRQDHSVRKEEASKNREGGNQPQTTGLSMLPAPRGLVPSPPHTYPAPPSPLSRAPPHSHLFSATRTTDSEVYTVPLPSTRGPEEKKRRLNQNRVQTQQMVCDPKM